MQRRRPTDGQMDEKNRDRSDRGDAGGRFSVEIDEEMKRRQTGVVSDRQVTGLIGAVAMGGEVRTKKRGESEWLEKIEEINGRRYLYRDRGWGMDSFIVL